MQGIGFLFIYFIDSLSRRKEKSRTREIYELPVELKGKNFQLLAKGVFLLKREGDVTSYMLRVKSVFAPFNLCAFA